MNNDVSGFLFMILLALFAIYNKDFQPDDKIPVYLATCASSGHSESTCGKLQVGPMTVFRAIPQSQSVVSLQAGEFYRLHDCTVVDAKNWQCNEVGFVQSMRDGEYQAPWTTMTVRPVSWIHWQFLRVRGWFM